MSVFPKALKPAARSAYRAILRSARITFQGDETRKSALVAAVRQTFQSPTLTTTPVASTSSSAAGLSIPTDAEVTEIPTQHVTEDELSKRIEEWKEVALFLRRNVVQGQQDHSGAFKLRVTPDTELGDNYSIKNPAPLPSTPFPNRGKRRKSTGCGGTAEA